MKAHQYADLFPIMQGREFEELKKDISANGQREPIWIYYDEILDGRNEYRACSELGIAPKSEIYAGDDPLGFVISLNLHRRHLNESQRAMVAAKLANMNKTDNLKQGPRTANLQDGKTSRADAATTLSVSERTVNTAKKVQKEGVKRLQERVEQGGMAVSAAARVASKGKSRRTDEQQEKILSKLDSGEAKNVPQAIRRVEQEERIAAAPIVTDTRCRIEKGDCLELVGAMAEMPHLVITDPPYGIDTHNTRRGEADYSDGDAYAHSLLDSLCAKLNEKIAPDAHLYFFSGYTNAYKFKETLEKYFVVQDNPIIWVKDNHTMCDFSKGYPNKHEYIWFCRKAGSERTLAECVPDVIFCTRERSSTHSAEKPTQLLSMLIEQSSIKGEIVCDPFLGSGATGVAAKELDRQFVGFELDQSWYEVAASRLA